MVRLVAASRLVLIGGRRVAGVGIANGRRAGGAERDRHVDRVRPRPRRIGIAGVDQRRPEARGVVDERGKPGGRREREGRRRGLEPDDIAADQVADAGERGQAAAKALGVASVGCQRNAALQPNQLELDDVLPLGDRRGAPGDARSGVVLRDSLERGLDPCLGRGRQAVEIRRDVLAVDAVEPRRVTDRRAAGEQPRRRRGAVQIDGGALQREGGEPRLARGRERNLEPRQPGPQPRDERVHRGGPGVELGRGGRRRFDGDPQADVARQQRGGAGVDGLDGRRRPAARRA